MDHVIEKEHHAPELYQRLAVGAIVLEQKSNLSLLMVRAGIRQLLGRLILQRPWASKPPQRALLFSLPSAQANAYRV